MIKSRNESTIALCITNKTVFSGVSRIRNRYAGTELRIFDNGRPLSGSGSTEREEREFLFAFFQKQRLPYKYLSNVEVEYLLLAFIPYTDLLTEVCCGFP
jgi:hypothetical protein